MPILLFRVDERLIHGQVVVGWGSRLDPDRYVVVDDALADSEWEQELHGLGVPEGAEARFVDVAGARASLDRWRASERRVMLLTRDLETMLELARGGLLAGEAVNLGGIHHATGREKVLEEEDVTVTARDLPGSTPVGTRRLLE